MSGLRAGAARAEITPQRMGLRMGGHAVNRTAVDVRDPLYARAVAMSTGDEPLVIVSLDLVGLMRGFVEKIRDRVPELPRDRVWICCTHTHDSPDTIGFWGPMIREVPLRSGLDADYMEFLIGRTVEAIKQATANMASAQLEAAGVVTPSTGLSRNVRQECLKDDEIQIMHLRHPRGPTIAVLYNYACHPEFFGHHHRRLSAGWPGVTNATLEHNLGGVALLVQNALGGMVTGAVSRDDGAFDPMEGTPFVTVLGRSIAEFVQQGLQLEAKTVEVDRIETEHVGFDIQVTNRLFLLAAWLNVVPRWMLQNRNTLTTEVNIARLGPITMATLPGEALPEVGFAVKHLLDSQYPWVLNLANDELGYLLLDNHWDDPRYEYECSMSVGRKITTMLLDRLANILSSGQNRAE